MNQKNNVPKPLKRHIALQPLSREHHEGLLLSWKIRKGLDRKTDISRIKEYCDWFWETHLQSHFQFEESRIFTILDQKNELIARAVNDHIKIKKLFEANTITESELALLAEKVTEHIRFEERVLFPEIEKKASETDLNEIIKSHQTVDCELWHDPFWKD